MGVKLPTVDTCCTIDLDRGSRYIAIAMVVLGILGVISNLVPLAIFGLIVAAVILVVAILLYVGISKQNQQFVRIFLVVEGILIILTIIEVVILILGLVAGGAVSIIWGLLFIVRIYFWIVIFSFYQKMIGGTGEVGGPSTTQPV